MRAINKNLVYSDFTLQLHVNCDGSIEYSVDYGPMIPMDIEISESVHDYFVNPAGEYTTKLFQGTKGACVCYVVEFILSMVRI